MPAVGALRDRYIFQPPGAGAIVGGLNRLSGGWGTGLTVWAQTVFLHGTEAVQAARLQGKQPVILTIRASSATKAINNSWRAVDARDGTRVFNITGIEITPDLAFLQILATTQMGQANGG